MHQAFQLSEDTGLPVMVRVTRALVFAQEPVLRRRSLSNASACVGWRCPSTLSLITCACASG